MTAQPVHQPTRSPAAMLSPAGEFTPEPKKRPTAIMLPARGDFATLRILSEMFHDAQDSRISIEHRLNRGGIDRHVFGDEVRQAVKKKKVVLEHLPSRAFEKAMAGRMRGAALLAVRAEFPAVETWAGQHYGLNLERSGRLLPGLLGALGHPAVAYPHAWVTGDPPDGHECDGDRCGKERHLVAYEPRYRSLRELWAYCGHGDPARRGVPGMSAAEFAAMGSSRAKVLVHLLAEATIKCGVQPIRFPTAMAEPADVAPEFTDPGSILQPSAKTEPAPDRFKYRRLYDARRATTTDRLEADGTPWSVGHSHNDALRIVGKEILRDLWHAAHVVPDSQSGLGGVPDTPPALHGVG